MAVEFIKPQVVDHCTQRVFRCTECDEGDEIYPIGKCENAGADEEHCGIVYEIYIAYKCEECLKKVPSTA